MSEFKKGDLVVLKSGGPAMTVEDTGDYSGPALGPENGVKCVWFEDSKGSQKVTEHVFDAAVLAPYRPQEVKPRRSSVANL